MAIRQQPIAEILNTNISLPTQTIYLVGTVGENDVKAFHLGLSILDREGTVIDVLLNCQGGSTIDGLAIYDMLKACKAHVRITATGCAYSMGLIILQAGDERILTPSCRLMVHESSTEVGRVRVSDALANVVEDVAIDELTYTILAERVGITLKQAKNRFAQTVFFSAQEAIELGLADSLASS